MTTVSLRRGPVHLAFSAAPWTCAQYLLGYLCVGSALFVVAFTGAVRWCADVERRRQHPPVRIDGRYREPSRPGILARPGVRWRDPAIWRDIAYLLGLYVPLAVLDSVVLTVWVTLLAGITLPAWYWAPWQSIHGHRFHGYELGVFPNGPHAQPGYGFYIDSLPKALAAAAAFGAAFLLFNYVLVATARAHAHVARALLGPAEDPLRQAKEVLRRPGPLTLSIPNER